MDADDGLRASDRTRLVGLDGSPDAALVTKERMDHLRGAFDELSDVHTRVLVMRELEGMSYREIGQKLDLTRPAVESALFRAPPARERVRGAVRGPPLRGDGSHDRAHRRGRAGRRGGAATRASRAPLPQLPPPCPRAWDRAAVRAGRAAPEGRGAAAAALAPSPLRRRRQRDRWILLYGRQCGPAGGACRGSCGRGGAGGCWRRGARNRSASGGTARRPETAASRPSAPQRGRENRSAAPRGPPRAESGAERARRPGGEPPVRQGAAPATRPRQAAPAPPGSQHGAATAPSGLTTDGPGLGLPALPRTDSGAGSPSVELSLPETPPITAPQTPTQTLPRVELPAVPLPDTGSGHGRAARRPSLNAMMLAPARG